MSFTWNHRIIKSDEGYEFAEVYYRTSDKQPFAHCSPHIYGDTTEELRELAELLLAAAAQPVLDPAEFAEEE
jgi:hypothetical protein